MNYKKLSVFSLLFLHALAFLLPGCKKEEPQSREMMVFLQVDIPGRPTKTQTVPFVHSPNAVTGEKMVVVHAYASREVEQDVDIFVQPSVEESLLNGYNAEYKTSHLRLPAESYRMVTDQKRRIAAGLLQSEPIQIEITRPELLTDRSGYLLPLTITRIESKDKGVKISATHRTVYLKITYTYNNIEQTQVPSVAQQMARTGWSVSVSNTTAGALGPAMLDGSNTTAWRSSNSATAAKWVVLNMGSRQTIKGLRFVPNYVSAAENATQITVSSSSDNTNWTVQGVWSGTGPATGTNAANPDVKGINFIAPVEAQYYRLEINAWVSGSRVGIAELNAVQ